MDTQKVEERTLHERLSGHLLQKEFFGEESSEEDVLKEVANSAGIVPLIESGSEPKFLVVPMRHIPGKVKFPGGTSEDHEIPVDTLSREFEEETNIVELVNPILIDHIFKPPDHHKFWFLIEEVSGGPFPEAGQDHGILAPRLMKLSEVHKQLVHSHKRAFQRALEYLDLLDR